MTDEEMDILDSVTLWKWMGGPKTIHEVAECLEREKWGKLDLNGGAFLISNVEKHYGCTIEIASDRFRLQKKNRNDRKKKRKERLNG